MVLVFAPISVVFSTTALKLREEASGEESCHHRRGPQADSREGSCQGMDDVIYDGGGGKRGRDGREGGVLEREGWGVPMLRVREVSMVLNCCILVCMKLFRQRIKIGRAHV